MKRHTIEHENLSIPYNLSLRISNGESDRNVKRGMLEELIPIAPGIVLKQYIRGQ